MADNLRIIVGFCLVLPALITFSKACYSVMPENSMKAMAIKPVIIMLMPKP